LYLSSSSHQIFILEPHYYTQHIIVFNPSQTILSTLHSHIQILQLDYTSPIKMLNKTLTTLFSYISLVFLLSSPIAAFPLEGLFQRAPAVSYSIANNGGNLGSTFTTILTVTETQAATLTTTVTETASITASITQAPATVTVTLTETETETPLTTSTFDNGQWNPAKYVTVYFTTTAEAAAAAATIPAR
jgi:hypothetical protein